MDLLETLRAARDRGVAANQVAPVAAAAGAAAISASPEHTSAEVVSDLRPHPRRKTIADWRPNVPHSPLNPPTHSAIVPHQTAANIQPMPAQGNAVVEAPPVRQDLQNAHVQTPVQENDVHDLQMAAPAPLVWPGPLPPNGTVITTAPVQGFAGSQILHSMAPPPGFPPPGAYAPRNMNANAPEQGTAELIHQPMGASTAFLQPRVCLDEPGPSSKSYSQLRPVPPSAPATDTAPAHMILQANNQPPMAPPVVFNVAFASTVIPAIDVPPILRYFDPNVPSSSHMTLRPNLTVNHGVLQTVAFNQAPVPNEQVRHQPNHFPPQPVPLASEHPAILTANVATQNGGQLCQLPRQFPFLHIQEPQASIDNPTFPRDGRNVPGTSLLTGFRLCPPLLRAPPLDPFADARVFKIGGDSATLAPGAFRPQKITNPDYTMDRKLGAGGFGAVWDCLDPRDLQRVAVKVCRGFSHCQYQLRNLCREILYLDLPKHDNVLRMRSCILPDEYDFDQIILVLEHMPQDLFQLLREERPDIKRAKVIIYQIARGLVWLHSAQICHRDLKPENILINPTTNAVKIADLGQARQLDVEHPRMETHVCTPGYRAPELLVEYDNYDTSIDIWSLGVISFELLHPTGEHLVEGRNQDSHEQLSRIVYILGTPNLDAASPRASFASPRLSRMMQAVLPSFRMMGVPPHYADVTKAIKRFGPPDRKYGGEFLFGCISWDMRLSADDCTKHEFLRRGHQQFHSHLCRDTQCRASSQSFPTVEPHMTRDGPFPSPNPVREWKLLNTDIPYLKRQLSKRLLKFPRIFTKELEVNKDSHVYERFHNTRNVREQRRARAAIREEQMLLRARLADQSQQVAAQVRPPNQNPFQLPLEDGRKRSRATDSEDEDMADESDDEEDEEEEMEEEEEEGDGFS